MKGRRERGRGRLLLCEGHTPTVGWKGSEHPAAAAAAGPGTGGKPSAMLGGPGATDCPLRQEAPEGLTRAACGRAWGAGVASTPAVLGPYVLEWQVAGFRTFLFPPTRRFVSAPFSVTSLSYLRGNLELLVEG